MIDEGTDAGLAAHLMEVARNPSLRAALYERIGEYCHHSRNRLNSLKLSLYLVKQQEAGELSEAWSALEPHYQELERTVEHVQRLCRPITLARIRIGLELLIEDRRSAWTELWAARHDALRFVAPPEPVVALLDVDRLGHALDAVVAWRAEQEGGDRSATLAWWAEGGEVRLAWEETSASPSRPPRPDSRWSLPWLARVVAEHGGESEIRDDEPGWRLEVRWPSGPPAP